MTVYGQNQRIMCRREHMAGTSAYEHATRYRAALAALQLYSLGLGQD